MPFSYVDDYPQTPLTNMVLGTQTGTAIPLSSNSFPCSSVYITAHPSNSGTAWIVAVGGAMGYPLKPNVPGLYLSSLPDLNLINLYFEVKNDKVCYLAGTNIP